MSRILICGACPLPGENTLQNYGPGIRSWQFARGLASAGHAVELVAMKIPGAYDGNAGVTRERVGDVAVERVPQRQYFDRTEIERRIDAFRPDALVGATIYGSWALAQCRTELPLWADQFGHVMAEAQARAALDGDDSVLGYFWNMARTVGLRADKMSTVSGRQRYAAIGELGALGRLDAAACGYELVEAIPCAVVAEPATREHRGMLRGRRLPPEAFIVLWSGSYNVWSDVETLFTALEAAMARDASVHFVSTGGAIAGHDVATYPSFERCVEGSRYRDRFHLEGWVPSPRLPAYVADADVGILSERAIYEGSLGSKNRLVQWMAAGLPVIANRVGDLGDLLADHRLGLTCPPGDASALTERLVWAAAHRAELAAMAEEAEAYVRGHFSIEQTTRPLAAWAAAPRRAPGVRPPRPAVATSAVEGRLMSSSRELASSFPLLRRLGPLVRVGRRLLHRVLP
ncbi:MAG TPA: glycosyltransferase [Thermoanaerobaculia bacterium]|nr:glycosyltransferase [Thermoanaerobaculia bacterium]